MHVHSERVEEWKRWCCVDDDNDEGNVDEGRRRDEDDNAAAVAIVMVAASMVAVAAGVVLMVIFCSRSGGGGGGSSTMMSAELMVAETTEHGNDTHLPVCCHVSTTQSAPVSKHASMNFLAVHYMKEIIRLLYTYIVMGGKVQVPQVLIINYVAELLRLV